MDEDTINKMIDEKIEKALAFATKKYGDTPTDALQLTPKQYVDGLTASKAYIGVATSTGASTPFPTGWTWTKNGAGDYTITHNLGTTSYIVVATSINDTTVVVIASQSTNSFNVTSWLSTTGNKIDDGFNFILIKL